MAPTRKSYVSLTSTQKFKLLEDIKNGTKQADAARNYGVERTTISELKTQEAKIRQANLENKQPDKKRVKVSGGEDVQKAMLTWFRQARSENIPINGPLLLEKAHSIAIQLGSDFVPNASWLERVKKRENISFNKLHGAKKAAKIMASFNSKMRSKNRKGVLFCDNASCHKSANELTHVKIVLMPPNTTSIIQPLDQGIIRNIKVYYRTQLMRQMVISLDAGVKPDDFAESITISKALYMLKHSVFLVKPSTNSNCFSKAGFEVHTESTIVSEDDEPEVVLPGISSEEFTVFVDIDENYQTSRVFTDQEICEQILEQNDTTETTIIDDESEEVIPTTLKALKMIHAIRLYCTTLPNANYLQAKIDSIENAIESQPKPRKQSSLIDFFRLAK